MPDLEENNINEKKDYFIGIPVKKQAYFLKGLDHHDWGIKDRMSRIFNVETGRTVMLAFDHGYIMGPTSGLERLDLAIPPLIPYADSLMCTRGALRSIVPPTFNKPVCLRYSAGTTVLTKLNDECVIDIEEAVRMNVSAIAVMVSIGDETYEAKTIKNLVRTVDYGYKYSIPVLGVTAVGKDLVRDARYLSTASRVCAENGASFVKTYYCEDFAKVVNSCPVPIVIAGGKKLPEKEALELCYKSINDGAAGVDMGRNVFQSENPVAMIQAVRSIVHQNFNVEQAFQMYQDINSNLK